MGVFDDPAKGKYVKVLPDFGRYPAQSAPHRGEPYVRVRLERVDGGEDVQDAKAVRWTATHVLVYWEDSAGSYNIWVTPDRVTRIKRCESSWKSVHDRYEAYGDDY